MKKKYNLLIILILFLNHCGFTPIYDNQEKINFKFNIIDIKGDDEMNNFLNLQINKYSSKDTVKEIDLNIVTNFKKSILTKNKAGEATSYLLVAEIKFDVVNSTNKRKFVFKEETKTKNIENKFELKKYESVIKNNFVSSKIEELILRLSVK